MRAVPRSHPRKIYFGIMAENALSTVRHALFAMRDEKYAAFQSRLMPTVARESIIGVRTPALRAYAKKLAKSPEAELFLASLPHAYYEENNLHAALLEQIRDADTAFDAVEKFLPYIDNWATCDSFCPKCLRNDLAWLWEAIERWLVSDRPYTVRFALVRLTAWYLDDPHLAKKALDAAAGVTHPDYYVRMAQAWLLSFALIKQYETALPYLTERRFSPWIHNKAIQKAIESYRTPPLIKAYLKTLRRKTHESEE